MGSCACYDSIVRASGFAPIDAGAQSIVSVSGWRVRRWSTILKSKTVLHFQEVAPKNQGPATWKQFCPATFKRTQCSGRQHQSVQFDWQAQWIWNMHYEPPLEVFQFCYKLQHLGTSRAEPLQTHPRTTPKNHCCFLNFDLEILKNAKLKSSATSKAFPNISSRGFSCLSLSELDCLGPGRPSERVQV